MPWLQVHLTVGKQQAPLVEGMFENLGALSVTLGDAADNPLLEPAPGETPLWQQVRVTALFSGDTDAQGLQRILDHSLDASLLEQLEFEELADQAWERAWLDDFHPMRFGERLWICPSGQLPETDEAVTVEMDPGLAFGTGTHPTTALCLRWLEGLDLDQKRLLDLGCGSGILSVAALKLGAEQVNAIDHDPQALDATRANAEKNGVADALSLAAEVADGDAGYDLVVANILASTLVELEPLVARITRPGGMIALSGILLEQADSVTDCYSRRFQMQSMQQLDDWVLLSGQRLN